MLNGDFYLVYKFWTEDYNLVQKIEQSQMQLIEQELKVFVYFRLISTEN